MPVNVSVVVASMSNVRMLLLFEDIFPNVIAYPRKSNVPFVRVRLLPIPLVMFLVIVHLPPMPLNVRLLASVIPPKSNVLPVVVELNVIVLVNVLVIPVVAHVTLPATVIVVVPATVTAPVAGPANVQFRHTPALIVTVYAVPFDKELKITSSATVGNPAPPDPPEDKDQLVVVAASHVPVPPTQ